MGFDDEAGGAMCEGNRFRLRKKYKLVYFDQDFGF